jgi:hypothetical protein
LPIEQLWIGNRLLSNIKTRELTIEQAEVTLSLEKTRLVFALIGKELYWVPNNTKPDIWRHFCNGLIDSLAINLHWKITEYIISEWVAYDNFPIVLIELF